MREIQLCKYLGKFGKKCEFSKIEKTFSYPKFWIKRKIIFCMECYQPGLGECYHRFLIEGDTALAK